jgi:hypothetical protein
LYILSGKRMVFWCSCLMDFKGHIINVSALPIRGILICTRSTAVKFGIPLRPVLKHGPRSLSSMQVNGYNKPICVNNLTIQWDYEFKAAMLGSSIPGYFYQHMLAYGKYTMSILDMTRKMVNYAWSGWSQGKPWWRTEAILTCKSIVRIGHRGERPIEPSSSWFLPKFPSG